MRRPPGAHYGRRQPGTAAAAGAAQEPAAGPARPSEGRQGPRADRSRGPVAGRGERPAPRWVIRSAGGAARRFESNSLAAAARPVRAGALCSPFPLRRFSPSLGEVLGDSGAQAAPPRYPPAPLPHLLPTPPPRAPPGLCGDVRGAFSQGTHQGRAGVAAGVEGWGPPGLAKETPPSL